MIIHFAHQTNKRYLRIHTVQYIDKAHSISTESDHQENVGYLTCQEGLLSTINTMNTTSEKHILNQEPDTYSSPVSFICTLNCFTSLPQNPLLSFTKPHTCAYEHTWTHSHTHTIFLVSCLLLVYTHASNSYQRDGLMERTFQGIPEWKLGIAGGHHSCQGHPYLFPDLG